MIHPDEVAKQLLRVFFYALQSLRSMEPVEAY